MLSSLWIRLLGLGFLLRDEALQTPFGQVLQKPFHAGLTVGEAVAGTLWFLEHGGYETFLAGFATMGRRIDPF